MKKPMLMCAVVGGVAAGACAQSYFQYSGGTVTFTKAAFADPNDTANWDVITSDVALTRSNLAGIYNPIQEPWYVGTVSPMGTLWYFGGTVADVIGGSIGLGDFDVWEDAKPAFTPSIVGMNSVMYLQAHNAYVDFMVTSWGVGIQGGGAVSWRRAYVPAPASAGLLGLAGLCASRRRR